MTPIECAHETAIVDEIEAGRWPDASPVPLREHAASCAVCGDLALVVSEMHQSESLAPATLPSAGQVWWRAELRARHEAARLAQRPVIAVQVVAAVVCLAALFTGIRMFAPGAWGWFVQIRLSDAALSPWGTLLMLSVGFWLVLAPLAVYMVMRADRQGGR